MSCEKCEAEKALAKRYRYQLRESENIRMRLEMVCQILAHGKGKEFGSLLKSLAKKSYNQRTERKEETNEMCNQ